MAKKKVSACLAIIMMLGGQQCFAFTQQDAETMITIATNSYDNAFVYYQVASNRRYDMIDRFNDVYNSMSSQDRSTVAGHLADAEVAEINSDFHLYEAAGDLEGADNEYNDSDWDGAHFFAYRSAASSLASAGQAVSMHDALDSAESIIETYE